MKRFVVFGGAALVALAVAIPVFGINYGNPDNNEHPYVGLAVFFDADGEPLWRCSGTLLSPTVFLTAGHCTAVDGEDVPVSARVYFNEDVQALVPPPPNDPPDLSLYPYGGGHSFTGTPYTHPDYDPNAFYMHDLGVVVLDDAVTEDEFEDPITYGQLPAPGLLDTVAKGKLRNQTYIKAVGYGLQDIVDNPVWGPVFIEAQRIRLQADLKIVDINGTGGIPAGTSVLVSGDAKHGGTCFGDSGGPQFLNDTNVVVAVTSFGLNGNCAGVGGGYRVDQQDDLDWLSACTDNATCAVSSKDWSE